MTKFLVSQTDVEFEIFFQDSEDCDGHCEKRKYPKGTYFQCDVSSPTVYLDLDGDGMLYVNPDLCIEIDLEGEELFLLEGPEFNVVWQE